MINLISGNSIKYYNGLHIHRRFNVMRWHPNTRGFGFQADIICLLIQKGASYLEVSVPAINNTPSRALTLKNFLSVAHVALEIFLRRLAKLVFG
jgi:hypothetical protein